MLPPARRASGRPSDPKLQGERLWRVTEPMANFRAKEMSAIAKAKGRNNYGWSMARRRHAMKGCCAASDKRVRRRDLGPQIWTCRDGVAQNRTGMTEFQDRWRALRDTTLSPLRGWQ